MDNISNLNLLISILLNGMLIVFLVLSLVFFIGKLIIKLFSSINPKNDENKNIKSIIEKEVHKISNGKGKLVSYKKI
tara:strand:+ start:333 stop:563 length:231 start_codon:yes stop_codon:yes gene_type:complete